MLYIKSCVTRGLHIQPRIQRCPKGQTRRGQFRLEEPKGPSQPGRGGAFICRVEAFTQKLDILTHLYTRNQTLPKAVLLFLLSVLLPYTYTLIGCSVRLWNVPMLKMVDTSDRTGDNSQACTGQTHLFHFTLILFDLFRSPILQPSAVYTWKHAFW